jgi:hypothetical protein
VIFVSRAPYVRCHGDIGMAKDLDKKLLLSLPSLSGLRNLTWEAPLLNMGYPVLGYPVYLALPFQSANIQV